MSSDFKVDADAIRELAQLLDETGLSEIEVEDAGQRLRVARTLMAAGAAGAAGAAMAASPSAPADSQAQPAGAPADSDHPGAITSPMVGTAYLAPEPGAAAFVKPGDQISEGQTLLIVEAMKVMNPIRAPKDGTISRVLIENGSPVEFGQLLMILD
jgi:acetyl-CoA carboxylase biotin carboxyl carrier protein